MLQWVRRGAALLCLLGTTVSARAEEERYWVPLVRSITLYHTPSNPPRAEDGGFRLIQLNSSSPGGSYSFTPLVSQVERIAVVVDFVIGQSRTGYFIVDSRQDYWNSIDPVPLEQWQVELRAAGIDVDTPLTDPEGLSTGVSDRVLRPWNYRVARGLLGYSDLEWSLIVQIVGLLLAFSAGYLRNPDRRISNPAFAIGLATTILGPFLLEGGGPAAALSVFGMPLLCWGTAGLGRLLRMALPGRAKSPCHG